MNINKIMLPDNTMLSDALEYMHKYDLALVHHQHNVYLCYKENSSTLRTWNSAILIDKSFETGV